MDEGPENITGEMPVEQPIPTEFREKMWGELADAEKVERMRIVVLRLQDRLRNFQNEVDRLERHEHGHAGNVLVPLNTPNTCDFDVSFGGDKDRWF